MNRLSIRSTRRAVVAAPLVLALLARVPFADALLLHDHGDNGIHSHTVTLDDMRDGDLCASWYHYHDGIHDDDRNNRNNRNNDSDGGEYADSLFLFVSVPATALGIPCSSGTGMVSIQHPSSTVLPRSMLPSHPTATTRVSLTPWPSAHPLRPAFALDALLQSSQALLL